MSDFRDLRVYRRIAAVSDRVHASVADWSSFDLWTTGAQLLRAIDSVGANIAEGVGRRSDADRQRFLVIARGSLSEAEHWLMRASARGLLETSDLESELREVGRMLNGLLRAFRAR